MKEPVKISMKVPISVSILSFTKGGEALADRLYTELVASQITTVNRKRPFSPALEEQVRQAFQEEDALIFIGAAGIAVRSIAPFLKNKYTDPAVIVIDERGKYCISLLSGHVGGANTLARQIAQIIQAEPVITTATDVNDCFAVDVFARENNLTFEPAQMCKQISAALLQGEKVLLKSDFPIVGTLPKGLETEWKEIEQNEKEADASHIYVTLFPPEKADLNTLYLMPKILTIGVGCRKGTSYEKIEYAITQSLRELGAAEEKNRTPNVTQLLRCIQQIASIDLKKEEMGILKFSEKYNIPYRTFTAEELKSTEGVFTPSDFVQEKTGVDNVCERAAMRACENGKLIQKKMIYDGVTIAVAQADWSVEFE